MILKLRETSKLETLNVFRKLISKRYITFVNYSQIKCISLAIIIQTNYKAVKSLWFNTHLEIYDFFLYYLDNPLTKSSVGSDTPPMFDEMNSGSSRSTLSIF